jgi:poly-gamma-glutamate synthesis protein (capsule biosynthesis protein)
MVPADPITIALTGDVMLGRLVNSAFQQRGPAYPLGDVLPVLQAADLRIVNLECVIASSGRPWARWHKAFHFRADPIAIQTLKLAAVDCVSLANNHVLDYGEEALLEMLDLLERNGIPYTGAGRNLEAARQPALLGAKGLHVGVIAFTDNEPGWLATKTSPGTNYIPISSEQPTLTLVRKSIADAREARADLVVFSMHWGPNMRQRPSLEFRQFAHAVIEAGADVFYGHSAHVFQGIEMYRERPIFYDTGDFVDDYAVDPDLRNDYGLLFRVEAGVEDRKVRHVELTPLLISDCRVNLAAGGDRAAIIQRISDLSSEMGTMVRQDGERLSIHTAPRTRLRPCSPPCASCGAC